MFDIRDPDKRRQLLRFLAVGIGNTLFGYTFFGVLVVLGVGSGMALLGATVAGVVFNFFTTGRLVFANRDSGLLPRFVIAYGVTYLFNLALLKALEALLHHPLIAQLICLVPTVALSYFLFNRFVFRPPSP